MPPESDNPLPSLTASHVVVVAGKGGVGKTTVTAVIARAAADAGRHVLVVELDGKPVLDDLLPDIEVRHLSAPDLLDEYLRDHGFRRIAKRLNKTGIIDLIGTAAPGIDDVVVLGKVKQLARDGAWDLIVVDGPAAGHAITFLTSARGLGEVARGGPVKSQSDEVLELLHDRERFQTVLVTLPETTPVNELVETAFALEEDVGIRLGPVVVNNVDTGVDLPPAAQADAALDGVAVPDVDDLRAAFEFRRGRRTMETEELARLSEQLPLRQVWIPMRPVAGLRAIDVAELAADLTFAHPEAPT